MDVRATQQPAQRVSQAIRKGFFDRYNGVIVTETVAFGHPTTQRMSRRTFTVAAKNFYFAAVVAPMLLREREDKLAEVELFLRDNLAKARKGFDAELEQVRAIARCAWSRPSSNDHLKLFKLAAPEAPVAEAAAGTNAEAQTGELIGLEPPAQVMETEALRAA